MAGLLRFCSLSSSSVYGNSYFVETPDGARLLIDCGVTLRRLERCLADLAVPPSSISGVFVTHNHGDHTAALDLKTPFAQKYHVPVFAPPGFWRVWAGRSNLDGALCRTVVPGGTVEFGPCSVSAFLKPHDTVEPVGYTVRCGGRSLSVVTDLGCVPDSVADAVRDSECLVFESNHDRDMELNSGRSRRLICRVLSDVGHLSNVQAADALSRIVSRETKVVLLSHLSLDCNRPGLALDAVRSAVSHRFSGILRVAPAGQPSEVFSL